MCLVASCLPPELMLDREPGADSGASRIEGGSQGGPTLDGEAAGSAARAARASGGVGAAGTRSTGGRAGAAGGRGGSADSSVLPSGGGGVAGTDSGGDAGDAAADGPAAPGCAGSGLHGPVLVGVVAGSTGYCIDATEVTVGDYRAFLDAGVKTSEQSATCVGNADFQPAGGLSGQESDPVTNVDWCDALKYCVWAGKRLCGNLSTGSNPFESYADPGSSEWYAVCSSGGRSRYPYGKAYDSSACTGADSGGALTPVGSSDACKVNGVYDLSGSVWEWENSCTSSGPDGGSGERCRIRGGGYDDVASSLACDADSALDRSASRADVGFRCCQGALPQ